MKKVFLIGTIMCALGVNTVGKDVVTYRNPSYVNINSTTKESWDIAHMYYVEEVPYTTKAVDIYNSVVEIQYILKPYKMKDGEYKIYDYTPGIVTTSAPESSSLFSRGILKLSKTPLCVVTTFPSSLYDKVYFLPTSKASFVLKVRIQLYLLYDVVYEIIFPSFAIVNPTLS